MANIVGSKGQVVIEKEIRDQLGVQPGWLALQRLVDGHVELYFVPPEHNRSLAGIFAKYAHNAAGMTWDEMREAWPEAAVEEFLAGEERS